MQLEDILSQGEEKCLQKPCVQSEQCCPGSVCVDLHSHSSSSLSSMNNNKQRPGEFQFMFWLLSFFFLYKQFIHQYFE